MAMFPPLVKAREDLCVSAPLQNLAMEELVLSGVGWLGFGGKLEGPAHLDIWTPGGISVFMREAVYQTSIKGK